MDLFGYCAPCSKLLAEEDGEFDRCNGTPAFLAPEMMRPHARYRWGSEGVGAEGGKAGWNAGQPTVAGRNLPADAYALPDRTQHVTSLAGAPSVSRLSSYVCAGGAPLTCMPLGAASTRLSLGASPSGKPRAG